MDILDEIEMLKMRLEIKTQELNKAKEKEVALKNLVNYILEEYNKEATKEETTYYNRSDIMQIFGCKEDKAKNILKFAQQVGLATTIGNHTVITRKNMLIFIDEWYKGQKLNITF